MKIEPKLMTPEELEAAMEAYNGGGMAITRQKKLLAHIAAMNEQLDGVGELVEICENIVDFYTDGGLRTLYNQSRLEEAIAKVKGERE